MRAYCSSVLAARTLTVTVALGMLGLPADAGADILASDTFDNSANLLTFSQNPPPGAVQAWAPGDWFGEIDPESPPSQGIPPAIADESSDPEPDPADSLGVVDSWPDSNATQYTSGFKSDKYFGVVDLKNPNFPSPSIATATWEFDISRAAEVTAISIDMGAMGDFEGFNDRFDWFYQIDNGPVLPLFTSSVDDDGSATYTMANGDSVELEDPLMINGTQLLTDKTAASGLPTRTAAISGIGATLTLSFEAEADGGTEAYVFDNILVIGEPGTGVVLGDVNRDGAVNGLDVGPFVGRVTSGTYQVQADMNRDGWVNGLDVEPFVQVVLHGAAQAVPEPSTAVLVLVGLVGLPGRRKR